MVQLTFKSRRLIAAAAEVARCNALDEALFKSRKNIPRGVLICYCTNSKRSKKWPQSPNNLCIYLQGSH